MAEAEKPMTMDDLKLKVTNYRNFATKETTSENVFTSAVFDKAVIQKIFDSTPHAEGVRIYMAKDSDNDSSHDVSYLVVPVTKDTDGSFTDQIDDDHEIVRTGLLNTTMCIGPLCKGGKLIEG